MVKDSARAYMWNSESKSWIYHVRYLYRYDTKGFLTDNFWYNGMSNAQLLSEYYVSYAYDSSGNQTEKIWQVVKELFKSAMPPGRVSIRLLGVGVSGFDNEDSLQGDLFSEDAKYDELDKLTDEINQRFGKLKIHRGRHIK